MLILFETILHLSTLQVFGHPNRLRRTCIVENPIFLPYNKILLIVSFSMHTL